ncbi:MAG: NfeD family protein [Spirochaetota bacterium]
MKRLCALASVFLLAIVLSAGAASPKKYAVVSLASTVNPIVSEYIVTSMNKAQDDGAQFIILTVDTPGGLMDSMREIIKSIMTSKVPVVVYTYPKGAQAASAGGFIMLSGHLNAMSPGTEIGAMHPVSPFMDFGTIMKDKDQKDVGQEVMAAKVLNDTVAYGMSIAQKRGRSVIWTENAIRRAYSSTYKDAKAAGVVDIIAEDMDDLLRQLNGKAVDMNGTKMILPTAGISRADYQMDWKQKFMNFFADPQIVFFLFIIAVVGIGMEFKNPGMIFPGTIGVLSFIMFLLAVRILPINFAGLALIILAIVLFVLELTFTSYGLLTLGGIVSFVLGAMFLFDSPLPGYSIPITSIIATVIFVLVVMFGIVGAIIRVHKGKVVTGKEGLIGEKGIAHTDIDGKGKVSIHGDELWSAASDMRIVKGDTVEVIGIDGMVLIVKKA